MIEDHYLPLDQLLPDLANYNLHSPEQVALLASQILAVGFTAPFLVGTNRTICAGHRRRLALLKLRADNHAEPDGVKPGWLVPCRVGDWTEVQRLKVLIGDNVDPAAIDYDTEKLTALLATLSNQGELEGSGYDEARLEELLGGLAGEGVDPNAEWEGMPEFEQPDAMPYRTIDVHFADEEAAQDFARLIGQGLTEKTKYVWHPEQKAKSERQQYECDEP